MVYRVVHPATKNTGGRRAETVTDTEARRLTDRQRKKERQNICNITYSYNVTIYIYLSRQTIKEHPHDFTWYYTGLIIIVQGLPRFTEHLVLD